MTNGTAVSKMEWIVFVILAFIWGASFILIKKSLISFSSGDVGLLRITISGLTFLPFLFFSKFRLPLRKWPLAILISIVGNGIPAFMYAAAETRLGSAVTGVLNSLSPIFALIIGVLFFKLVMNRNHLLGIFFGCAGLITLVISEDDWSVSAYIIFIILATLCYGLSANLVKYFAGDLNPIAISATGFVCLTALMLPVGFITGTFPKLVSPDTQSVALVALIVLSLFGTVLANVMFYWLIQRSGVMFSTAIAYAMPVMAIVWGSLDEEKFTWLHGIGFAFILTAIYTLRKK